MPNARSLAMRISRCILVRHVVDDKKVRTTIPIVVQERRPSAVVPVRSQQTALTRHVGESAIAVIVVKNVLPVVSHEKIEVAIAIVVSNANSLPPTMVH